VSAFVLACLAYLFIALPGSTLGQLWPSIRLSLGVPVGALGILLAFGVAASVVSSAATGRILSRARCGPVLAVGTALAAVALAAEALAPALWVFAVGMVVFGLGFGAVDSALNAYAAARFGARDINWMHASYGLGATIGPLLVTALLGAGPLGAGLTWRWPYAIMAAALAAVALVLALTRRRWQALAPAVADPPTPPVPVAGGPTVPAAPVAGIPPQSAEAHGAESGEQTTADPVRSTMPDGAERRSAVGALCALGFVAVETGIESGAGIWGYLFLTAGRGLSHPVAGVAVSAYWAMMFAGRAVLGPVAQRVGAHRVLAGGVVGVPFGAAVMALPGPGLVGVVGLMIVGLAAAPIFPLLTLTTAERTGAARSVRTVSLQVAASAVGGSAVPAGLGLAIQADGAGVLAPLLLVLGVAMGGWYALVSRQAGLLRPGRLRSGR
jgi:fucose permease